LKVNANGILNVYMKRICVSTKMCGGISMMGLFIVTAGLIATYGITTFGPKLSFA
jgi:hypothetical protein